jgi:sugar phosphate isomerase/epimerase
MKYSMMTYTITRQPGFDIKKMLDLTVELEMNAIDFCWPEKMGVPVKDLRKMCDDRGIKIVCSTFSADLNFPDKAARLPGMENCRREIGNAVVLGAPVIMIPTSAKAGLSSAESRKNWIAGLGEVAPIAKDAGIFLTVENFPGVESPFVTADELLEAVKKVPELRITFDNGNAFTGEDPAESFRKSAKYVVHAHFKDWDVSSDEKEGYRKMRKGGYHIPALIGEGYVDQKSCLDTMKESGYGGYINIEYEGNKYDAYEGVKRAVEYLRSLKD